MKINYLSNKSFEDNRNGLNIVFIHGNSMHSGFFLQQLESTILSDYNLIALDLPGHGKSRNLESYSIFKLVDALFETIKELNNIVLVGHSLGGHLSMQLLPKLGEKCKGILVFGAAPLKLPLNVEEAYCLNEDSAKFFQSDMDEISRTKLAKIIYDKKDEFFNSLLESLEKTDGAFRKGIAESTMSQAMFDEIEILKIFRGKVLLLVGENDKIINKKYIENLTEKEICNSGLKYFKNCGHSPHIEEPAKFNDMLLDFIDQLK